MKKLPPKYAMNFLQWFCREDYLEEIEGDLIELFEKQSEISPQKARNNFAWNVLRSFRLRNLKSWKGWNIIGAVDMSRYYVKIGWRSLLKNKLSFLINIAGLSLGVTCCLILLIFIRYESSFDRYQPHADRTYRVVQHTEYPEQTLYWNTTAYPLAEALRNDFPEMEIVTQTAGPVSRIFNIENKNGSITHFEENNVLFADSFYYQVFDLGWIAGQPQTAFQHANSIVLTESMVIKYFGPDQDVTGRTIKLKEEPLMITGVVKDAPGNTNLRYHMIISYEFFKKHNSYFSGNWSGNYEGTTFVVLKESGIRTNLESKISSWKKKYLKPEDDSRISYFLQPLPDIHNETLYGSIPGGYVMPKKLLRVAVFVALFILLIAIVNFINLITAKSSTRLKEVGVRKVVGSTRLDLIKQFVTENTLVVLLSLIFSIGLTYGLIDQLNNLLSIINLQLSFQPDDFRLLLLIGAGTILLATIYPAVVLTSFKPIQILKKDILLTNLRGFSLRKGLTVFQFVLVQLFVIAAIVVATQMNLFRNTELGFTAGDIVMTPAPEYIKLNTYRNSLLENKDIKAVAFGSGPPMAVDGFALGTTFRLPSQSIEEGQEARLKIGDRYYLDFYDLELVAGRNITENKESFDEFVVNEKLLKSFGWAPEEAIGKKLLINEGEATIEGVVKDYHNNSLQREISPCIILNWVYFNDQAFIKVAAENPPPLSAIEEIWKSTFSSSVYRHQFLDESIEKEYMLEQLIFKGFTIFSFLVMIIGCLGIFGLMSFLTLQKTKEVGIRKVLGATVMQIITFFSKEFILLIALAFIIAAPLTYYVMELWLRNFTYRIELTVWMFLTGGILTLLIALLTSGFHTVRAALTNPAGSLRSE